MAVIFCDCLGYQHRYFDVVVLIHYDSFAAAFNLYGTRALLCILLFDFEPQLPGIMPGYVAFVFRNLA